MTAYVTDTHSLFWYFTRPERLGTGARAALNQVATGSETLIVPVIVLAEVNHAKFRKVTAAARRAWPATA